MRKTNLEGPNRIAFIPQTVYRDVYTTAQTKLVMRYIPFSLQTNKASDFYNTKSETSMVRINLNSEDLRLN